MEYKTTKKTAFDAGNNVSDSNVTAGGQDQGNKDGGYQTGVSFTPENVNGVYNSSAKGPKSWLDEKDYNSPNG